MEKEKIERAAIELCTTEGQEEWVKGYGVSCFKDGARWRIDSAWHDGAASCEARRKALVLFENGSAKVYEDLRELSVERLWGYVDRFAYLDDLLPERKEETNGGR